MTNKNQCSAEERGSGSAVTSQQNLAITIFENEMFGTIRTAGTPDEPMFCLADVCRVLDLRTDNVVKTLHLGDAPYKIGVIDSMGRPQQAVFITEPNLYKVIMRSNKPNAEPFQDWVCGEVLPQIRKTGGYIPISAEDDEKTIMAKALQIMQRTLEQKDRLIEAKSKTIEHYSVLTDKARNSSLHYNVTEVAKELGYKTAGELYRAMEKKGLVVRAGARKWIPTENFPQKFWCWHPYRVMTKNGKIEGETLHLTEAAVVAIRTSRMRKNDNNNKN